MIEAVIMVLLEHVVLLVVVEAEFVFLLIGGEYSEDISNISKYMPLGCN